jgi:hypothetical protein
MPNQNIFFNRHIWRFPVVIFALLFIGRSLYAQEGTEQQFFTAPREVHDWIFLGNSETSSWEYDQRSLMQADSLHLRVRLRETPLEYCYNDVRGTKMWQQRSIRGYSDSLRFHPQYDYEGYEYYGFTILEEMFDLHSQEYSIRFAADYNLGGLPLSVWVDGPNMEEQIVEGSSEQMILNYFVSKLQSHADKY